MILSSFLFGLALIAPFLVSFFLFRDLLSFSYGPFFIPSFFLSSLALSFTIGPSSFLLWAFFLFFFSFALSPSFFLSLFLYFLGTFFFLPMRPFPFLSSSMLLSLPLHFISALSPSSILLPPSSFPSLFPFLLWSFFSL